MPAYVTDSSILTEVRTINSRLARLEQEARTGASQTTTSGIVGSGPTPAGGLTLAEGDGRYLQLSGGTVLGGVTLNSLLSATTATFSGNVTISGTLTATGSGFAMNAEVVHLAGTETVPGGKTFTSEQKFVVGVYTDPDPGVTRALKIGNAGMAVLGGIKSDSVATGSMSVTGSGITTTAITVSTLITATGGVDFGASALLDLTKSANMDAGGLTGTGLGDKVGLYAGTYGIGAQSGRTVFYVPATAAVSVREVNTAAGVHQSSGTDAISLFANGNATMTGALTSNGLTVSSGVITLPQTSVDGAALKLNTVLGAGGTNAAGTGHLAGATVGTYNLVDRSVTSAKLSLAAVATNNVATGTLRDSDSTLFRTATASTVDEQGQPVGGFIIANGAARVTDTQAFDGVAATTIGQTMTMVTYTGFSSPASLVYANLKAGEYRLTFYVKAGTVASANLTAIQMRLGLSNSSGAFVTDNGNPYVDFLGSALVSGRYVGYSMNFTITAAGSFTFWVYSIIAGTALSVSHVTVEPRVPLTVQEVRTEYIRDLAVTNAKVNDMSVSKLVAGSITSDDIYLGSGGHIYAGTKGGGRVELNSGGIFAYTSVNLATSRSTFETGLSGWANSLDASSVATTTTQAWEGTSSLTWSAGITTTICRVRTETNSAGIAVQPNTDYTFSVWARSAGSVNATQMYASFYDSAGTSLSTTPSAVVGPNLTSTWTRFSTTFTTSATTAFVALQFAARDVTAGQQFYLDAPQLEIGTTRTAFSRNTTAATAFSLDNGGALALTGAIQSGSTITGVTVLGTSGLQAGTGNAVFIAGSGGIQLGNAAFASAPFRVSMAGEMWATNAHITGELISGTIKTTTLDATNSINAAAINAGVISSDRLEVGVVKAKQAVLNPEFDTAGAGGVTTAADWTVNFENSGASTITRIADPGSNSVNILTAEESSFEGGTSPGWLSYNGTLSVSLDRAYSGTRSIKFVYNTVGAEGAAPYRDYSWVAGQTYTMSAWVYVPATNPDVRWRVYTNVDGSVETYGTAFNVKDQWFRMSYTFTATQTGYHNVGIFPAAAGATLGQLFYVDAVQIELGPVATAYSLTSGQLMQVDNAANAGGSFGTSPIPVTPGEIYDVFADIKSVSNAGPVYVRVVFGVNASMTRLTNLAPLAGSILQSSFPTSQANGYIDLASNWVTPAVGNYYRVGGTMRVPEGATHMVVAVYGWILPSAWQLHTKSVTATLKVGGTVIAGGVVKTENVAATGLSADVITAGTLRANSYVVVGSLASGQAHTIIDARTGSRGIRMYNGTSTTLNANLDNGTLTVTGTVNATGGTFSGTITGGAFVGGNFKTASAKPYVQTSSSSLYAKSDSAYETTGFFSGGVFYAGGELSGAGSMTTQQADFLGATGAYSSTIIFSPTMASGGVNPPSNARQACQIALRGERTGNNADVRGSSGALGREEIALTARQVIIGDASTTIQAHVDKTTTCYTSLSSYGFTNNSAELGKDNIVAVGKPTATAKIRLLRPVKFTHKGSTTERMSFVAEEIATVIPEAASYGHHDLREAEKERARTGVDPAPVVVGWDLGTIIAMNTAAIQQLIDEVELLKRGR